MYLFKIISSLIKIHNWFPLKRPSGIQGYQWVKRVGTFLYPFMGDEAKDREYVAEFTRLFREHSCVESRKGRTTYDVDKFFNLYGSKIKPKRYLFLRVALYFHDNGQKALALSIYDKLTEEEEDEEFKAVLVVKRQYFLEGKVSEEYIRKIYEGEEYKFLQKYKRAWGMVLLHLVEISFMKEDYEQAEGYVREILEGEGYKEIPFVYLYAMQMRGDIYFCREQYREANLAYGEVTDSFVEILSTKYLPNYRTSRDPLKLIIDSIVREYSDPSKRMQMHSTERRWDIIKSLSIGRFTEGPDNVRACYESNDLCLALRFYLTLMGSVLYRSQSTRIVNADSAEKLDAIYGQIAEFVNHFHGEGVIKACFPFKEDEQARHLFLMAEQYLRLNDILRAKGCYEAILKIFPNHLFALLRMSELRFLRPPERDTKKQAASLRDDISYFKRALSLGRGNNLISILFNYFIFKACSILLALPRSELGGSFLQKTDSDYEESLRGLASLMKGTPLGFYWQYLMLCKKGTRYFQGSPLSEIKKAISNFREFNEVNNLERYILRDIFGTDNLAIVNSKLREIRDTLRVHVEEKESEERKRKEDEERKTRQKKVFEDINEAVAAFFRGVSLPDDAVVLSALGVTDDKKEEFLGTVDSLIGKNRDSAGLVFLAFEDNSFQFAEVSVEIPFGVLREKGFAKVRFRKCADGRLSFVLFKEDGDFVQAVVPEDNILNRFKTPSLYHKLFYLVFLNVFAVSQDQVQVSSFGDIKFVPLTADNVDLANIFMYANPLVQLAFQRLMSNGLCDDESIRKLKEQIDIQRHLLVFKRSAYRPVLDDKGHLVINLDDFKDSPLRKFFDAVHAELKDGKILFRFTLSGSMEMNGEFTREGNMLINMPDKDDALRDGHRIEYSVILELENFILHLLNSALFEDVREVSRSVLGHGDKEKRYAKISRLIGYPDYMKEAFGSIYERYPMEHRRWIFEGTGMITNPFVSSDLFVLLGETPEGVKRFKPVALSSRLTEDDKLFQPRFIFASKALQRGKPVVSFTVYEFVLNTIVSSDRYKFGFMKKWQDATDPEREEVLKYLSLVKSGRVHNPLLEVDPSHDLGVSFGWRDLEIREEGTSEVRRVKVYYKYIPPHVKFMELQGADRDAVIDQMKAVK